MLGGSGGDRKSLRRAVTIGARACADAIPDGYTFCIISTDVVHTIFWSSIRSYDPIKSLEPMTVLFYLSKFSPYHHRAT